MATFSGNVHKSNLDQVKAVVDKLNKRAKKLGLEPLTLEIGAEKIFEDEFFRTDISYEVTITGESPVINGWKLVAVLNHFLDKENSNYINLIRTVPGEHLPEKYRSTTPYCDHCGHNRFRKDTFVVVHEDGTFKQVGSSCVADFLGHKNPKALLEWAKFPKIFEDGFHEWGQPSEYYAEYTVSSFLTMTSAVLRHKAWVSSAKSRETGEIATFVEVLDQFSLKIKTEDKIETIEEDKLLADGAVAWIKSLPEEEIRKNDYLYNCLVVLNTGIVNDKTFAITASIIPSYKRFLAQQIETQNKKPSNHFGSVGQKVEINVKFLYRNEYAKDRYSRYDSEIGYIYRFVDEDGNIFIWFTGLVFDFEKDQKLVVKGTVKAHGEYKSVKQTVLTRCKIKE
jgi:hypothetical protein